MSSRAWSWRHAILESTLPATTKFVLLVISCFMNELGEGCYRSTRELALFSSLSERSVCTHIEIAAREGWLQKSQHGFRGQRWKRHQYEPLWPDQGAEPRSAATKQPLNAGRKGAETNRSKTLNQVQRDKDSSRVILPTSPGALEGYSREFERLWGAWPESTRPCDRSLAAKRFAALSDADRHAAVKFAHIYRTTKGPAGDFAPMLPYLRYRLFTEFDGAPAIDQGLFVITPERPEWDAWLEHLQSQHTPSVVDRQAAKGRFLTPTRWPPQASESVTGELHPENDRVSGGAVP